MRAWLLQGRFDRFIARVSAHQRRLNGDWPVSEKEEEKNASFVAVLAALTAA